MIDGASDTDKRTGVLSTFHKSTLSRLIGVLTGHYIMDTRVKSIGLEHLTNDFCRNYRDEEK